MDKTFTIAAAHLYHLRVRSLPLTRALIQQGMAGVYEGGLAVKRCAAAIDNPFGEVQAKDNPEGVYYPGRRPML